MPGADTHGKPAVAHLAVGADEAGMRLDRYLRAQYPAVPFGALSRVVRTGQVRVDGARVKLETRLAEGQTVRVPPLAVADSPVPPAADGDGAALDAMTLYRDDQLAVLNKPYGLAVQGGSGVSRHVDGMLEAWRDRKGHKPRLVHRLDRETTGVLVVALTRSAAAFLAEAFRGRDADKSYLALVRGRPNPPAGTLVTWLARDPQDGEKMAVVPTKTKDAQKAISHYARRDQAGQLTLLSLSPQTGRTHQLRVHCAHMGTPIVGDSKYFDVENWALPGGIQNRLHLHAARIRLPHPSGTTLDVAAPPAPHFSQSLSVLGLTV